MLPRELFEDYRSWLRPSRLHVFKTLADRLDRFLEVLAVPCQGLSENLVQRSGWVLAVALRIFS